MENLMKCLATKHQASITIATVYDLTRIYPDEVRFTQNCTNNYVVNKVQILKCNIREKRHLMCYW